MERRFWFLLVVQPVYMDSQVIHKQLDLHKPFGIYFLVVMILLVWDPLEGILKFRYIWIYEYWSLICCFDTEHNFTVIKQTILYSTWLQKTWHSILG